MGSGGRLLLTLMMAVLLVAGAGCGPTSGLNATPTPVSSPVTGAATAKPQASPAATATTGLPQAIVVVEPKAQQSVRSPLRIAGHARVYEGTVRYELVGANGNVLGQGFATATAGAPEVGYFSAELTFTMPAQPGAGVLRIFGDDPRDGKRAGMVEVPLSLGDTSRAGTATGTRAPVAGTATATPAGTAGRTLSLKVHLLRRAANDVLQPVETTRTIPYTNAMGRASLEELLKGPTAEEKGRGLETAIPAGVGVKSLRIENGVAYADFDAKLQQGVSGATRINNIRRQITLTLQQFSTVQRVEISIDGRTAGVLQP